MIRVIAIIILAAMPAMAFGQVYKCKDAAGKIHYQDRACTGDKKRAGFNSSAGNITGIDSQAARAESSGYLAAREEKRQAERPRYSPEDDVRALGTYLRERDRLDSAINRTPADSMRNRGKRSSTGETERAMLERQRRNLEAQENARRTGKTYRPEEAPVIVKKVAPAAPTGSQRIYEPSTNRWCWNHGNGAPLQCAP